MSENEEIMNETENETMAAEVEAVETVETEAAEVEAADEVSAEEEAEVVEAAVDYDDEELMDKMQKAARLLRSRRFAISKEEEAKAERMANIERAIKLLDLKPKMEQKEMSDLLGMRLRELDGLMAEAEAADLVGRIDDAEGDMRKIVLAPASVQEMASLTVKGFDLADQYRMIAMILADGTMGQMMEPVELPEVAPRDFDRSWAATGTKMQRTHNIINSLCLKPEQLEQKNFERFEKYRQVEAAEAMYESYCMEDATLCIVSFGITARVAKNAIAAARAQGIKVGMIRPITLWPFPEKQLHDLAGEDHVKVVVDVEMSLGQMIDDVRLAVEGQKPVKFAGVAGGLIPTVEDIVEAAKNALKEAE